MNFQNNKKLIKDIGIGLVVLLVLALAYYFFVNNSSPKNTSTPATVTPPAQSDAVDNTDQIANTLTQLNGLRQGIVDSKNVLENNHAFKSLNDFSVVISAQPYGGRENPFAKTPDIIRRDEEISKTGAYAPVPAPVPSAPATSQDTSSGSSTPSGAN